MLRHGFYASDSEAAMTALGEDPQEYTGLVQSLVADLQPKRRGGGGRGGGRLPPC
jgi:hypothetical protein